MHPPLIEDDKADDANGRRLPYDEASASDPNVVVYRITGAFFFGAAASIGLVLDRIANTHRVLVIDLSAVPFLDSTAAKTVEGLAHNAARRGSRIILTGVSSDVQRALFALGVKPPLVKYKADIHAALRENRTRPPT
jgi:SulP family sulfate permease